MKYSYIENLRYGNKEKTTIDCDVFFEKYGKIPFSSSISDVEEHSREIFNTCLSGKYGPIQDCVEKDLNEFEIEVFDLENDIRSKRNLLLRMLDMVISNPLRWAAFNEQEKQIFSEYRNNLLDIPQQENFPNNVIWPDTPKNYPELIMEEVSLVLLT